MLVGWSIKANAPSQKIIKKLIITLIKKLKQLF